MTQLRCVSNCIIIETGRARDLFQPRRVPLTIGEIYVEVPGPPRENYRFVVDDESMARPYPDFLFEVIGPAS